MASDFVERREVRPSAYKGVCPSEPQKAEILKSQGNSKVGAGGADNKGRFKKDLSLLGLLPTSCNLTKDRFSFCSYWKRFISGEPRPETREVLDSGTPEIEKDM